MGGITSTSRRHKGGRDYDRCGNREATFLNPQNFANTIGKPTQSGCRSPQSVLHAIGSGAQHHAPEKKSFANQRAEALIRSDISAVNGDFWGKENIGEYRCL
jgi:hypothetical protein